MFGSVTGADIAGSSSSNSFSFAALYLQASARDTGKGTVSATNGHFVSQTSRLAMIPCRKLNSELCCVADAGSR